MSSPALAAAPPRLNGQVTDTIGALGGATDDVQAAMETLQAEHGVQLFVLFVETTDDLTITEFADETARVSSLGGNDALLVVALEDRSDAIWVSDSLPITDSELDEIIVDTLEPGLADGDFAGAVIATAEALGLATAAATAAPQGTAPPPEPIPTGAGNGSGGSGSDGGGLGLAGRGAQDRRLTARNPGLTVVPPRA